MNDSANLKTMVLGVLEGETRSIAASMTIEEIFQKRKLFKEKIVAGIAAELAQFGMVIYNANVREITDAPGSEYFKYRRQKALEGAVNQAKVDTANARMLGNIGTKEREGETRKMISKIEVKSNLSSKRPI